MGKLIDKLTPEQEAKFPEYVETFTKYGLSTDPLDPEKVQSTVEKVYKCSGLTPPAEIVICDSPVDAITKINTRLGQPLNMWHRPCYGFHDAYWVAFYEFFRKEVGVEGLDIVHGILESVKNLGWFWPFDEACYVSPRPIMLNRDAQGRLHSLTEKAIEYPDGTGWYYIHGIHIEDERIILHPETLTVDEILNTTNLELKRVMMTEIYGLDRFVTDSGATVIHQDKWGTLYRKEIPGDVDLLMVKVINSTPEQDGSFKPYFLRVHPECRPMFRGKDGNYTFGEPQKLTAKNAVASTFGRKGSDYNPVFES